MIQKGHLYTYWFFVQTHQIAYMILKKDINVWTRVIFHLKAQVSMNEIEKVYFRSQILELPSIGEILAHLWCSTGTSIARKWDIYILYKVLVLSRSSQYRECKNGLVCIIGQFLMCQYNKKYIFFQWTLTNWEGLQ